MAEPSDLLVVSVPGLSARMLTEHADRLPVIRRMAEHGSAATVVVLDGASVSQLEAALITGLLPEYLGVEGSGKGVPRIGPFWHGAADRRPGLTARVKLQHDLPETWRTWAKADPNLEWVTRMDVAEDGRLEDVDPSTGSGQARAVVVLSAWCFKPNGEVAGQKADPLDRPVLIAHGFEQPKSCVGICEIAGILQRVLTGERLTDAI